MSRQQKPVVVSVESLDAQRTHQLDATVDSVLIIVHVPEETDANFHMAAIRAVVC